MSRKQPKHFQFLVKTHKLTVFLTGEPTTKISELKEQALEALTDPVLAHHERFEGKVREHSHTGDDEPVPKAAANDEDEDLQLDQGDIDLAMDIGGEVGLDSIPRPVIRVVSDFELCKGVRAKETLADAKYSLAMTGTAPVPTDFQVLEPSKTVKDLNLNNWEMLYVKYREASSGKLGPVHVTPFPVLADEEEEETPADPPELQASGGAKRKRDGSP